MNTETIEPMEDRMEAVGEGMERATSRARILVVDDHPLFREGLVQLIARQEDMEVCGQAGDASHTVAAVESLHPDLILLDLRLGMADGLELIKSLIARHPDLRVLVVSQHDENLYAERALRAGARGYVMKEQATSEVLNAIRTVLGGELYVSHGISMQVLRRALTVGGETVADPFQQLSDRELQVFQMLGAGLRRQQIADQLGISPKTVETYQESLKRKFGVTSSRELFRRASDWMREKG